MSSWNKEQLEQMLFDVVDELNLSESAMEHHGPMATPPAELVRLVLDEKDRIIAGLKQGFQVIQEKKKTCNHELEPCPAVKCELCGMIIED